MRATYGPEPVPLGAPWSTEPAGHGSVGMLAAPEPAVRCWAALGDSFTAGTTAGERTWVDEVHARLAAAGGAPPRLLTLAREGARAADVEREQLDPALAAAPDLVTVVCGGNDVIGTVRPAIPAFADCFERIAGRLREELPGARILTATYPELAPARLRDRTRRRMLHGLQALNAAIRAGAARHGLALVDFAEHPGRSDGANLAADGVHPSPAGHREAARLLGAAIADACGIAGADASAPRVGHSGPYRRPTPHSANEESQGGLE